MPSKRLSSRRDPGSRAPSNGRARIYPYLLPEMHKRLVEYCAAKNQSGSAVVQEALGRHFDDTRDIALVMRRLDRLGRAFDRSHRDLELLSQAFSLFLQVWFAQAPSSPPLPKDAARRASAGRFTEFMEHLAEEFSNGHRFLDDLPKDAFPDHDELRAIALAQSDSSQPKGEPS